MNARDEKFWEEIPCNICGTKTVDLVFEAGKAQPAKLVRCKSCGLMYSSPRPRVDSDMHESNECDGLLKGVTTDINHRYRWRYEKESGQVRDFAPTRRILRKLYPQGGKMVEVGSGLGYLLRSFKDEGWDVLGVDPWKELPPHTRDIHQIETIPTILENAALPDASADVVIMLHVIEHVPDPVATLREIHRILKPGGHAVIETPRYDTLMFKMMGHRERSVKCEGHIYFFTFDTLRRTYEKAGFSQVDTQAVGRTLSAERFLWNIGTMSGSQSLRNGLGRLSDTLGLNKLRFTMNLRDMQRVVVCKDAM